MGDLLEALVHAIVGFGDHFSSKSLEGKQVGRSTMGCAMLTLAAFIVLLIVAIAQWFSAV